ncbi:Gfo/Idh/MocA family oxidoreductase [Armatimonas sp.]|uniref:Gfo/Idh/MocA family protein n=1 Tax=Armatimonas sp. TaxID=1872638 RepID=UPI00286A75AE|nr:Gfo/Idh/MocA family oxidoreductase [Armatimonas sp.]
MSKLRFAIVGCGVIHGTHVEAIRALPEDAELVAVCDEVGDRAKEVGEKIGVRHFTDLTAMLDWGAFDVLTVCTPSGLHGSCGVLGAKAGKHIVTEKPIEVTLAAADALIAACKENNVKLEVISQHRFSSGMQLLKGWLDEGKLGKLVYGESVTKWYRTQAYYDSGGWRGTWELDGGGALMNQGVHYVDQLRWIMGPVKSVAATMGTIAHERIEVEDIVSASIEFQNGAVGTLLASTAMFPGYKQSLEIYGTHGTVLIDNSRVRHAQFSSGDEEQGMFGVQAAEPIVKDGIFTATGEKADVAQSQGAGDPRAISGSGHVAHLKDLIGAIREDRETFMNGAEARSALELIVGVYESAKTGKRIQFPL